MASSTCLTSTLPDVLMIGTGEYTTGYVQGKASASDKKIGVVGLTFFDLQSPHRGPKVGKTKLAGTNGTKFPGIREHFKTNIEAVYKDIKTDFEGFPADDIEKDPHAFQKAIDSMNEGDIVTIVTPDDTHFEIAKAAIQKGLHVLITKPPVKTLNHHLELIKLAKEKKVLVVVEYHKRFDPIYSDARERIRENGDFGSYMSQPKFQLQTFKSWAGISSDISYYLNSHHIDFHCWAMQGNARPFRVVAMASNGVATSPEYGLVSKTEDTICLMVQWKNKSGTLGVASYTASWVAPKADVHSQQRFFYMGHKGEFTVDQAHRGYTECTDSKGFASLNPLYMKYTKDTKGRFSGQNGYGYLSIEKFVDAVNKIRKGEQAFDQFDEELATLNSTAVTTAILESGRLSLDNGGKAFLIIYDNENSFIPSKLVPEN